MIKKMNLLIVLLFIGALNAAIIGMEKTSALNSDSESSDSESIQMVDHQKLNKENDGQKLSSLLNHLEDRVLVGTDSREIGRSVNEILGCLRELRSFHSPSYYTPTIDSHLPEIKAVAQTKRLCEFQKMKYELPTQVHYTYLARPLANAIANETRIAAFAETIYKEYYK